MHSFVFGNQIKYRRLGARKGREAKILMVHPVLALSATPSEWMGEWCEYIKKVAYSQAAEL